MGGAAFSKRKYRQPDNYEEPPVHMPSVRSCLGKPSRGAYSPGELTMKKLRSRSDVCLLKVLQFELLRQSCVDFLERDAFQLGKNLIEFYVEVDNFKREGAQLQRKELEERAREIYGKYINPSSPCFTSIDQPTRKTVEIALSFVTIDIFDLAAEKAYQTLKFDIMPRYLVSEDFERLEMHVASRRGNSTRYLSFRTVLSEKGGAHAVMDFFHHMDNADGQACAHMVVEAIRLQTCTTPAQRISHLAAIQAILTANPALTLPSRLKAYVSQAWENNNGEADVNAIQDVIDWVCDTLQEQHIEDFMISPQYQNFLSECSEEYAVDNSIVELVNYKEDRKLYVTRSEYESNIQKTLTFDGCLCDPVASAYFRRFLRTQYSEESFLFYKEIVDFKAGKFATPSIGDPLRNVPSDATEQDLLRMRAVLIYDKYLPSTAPCSINVSDRARSSATEQLASNPNLNMFDLCQLEVNNLMSGDAFPRFKKHTLFEHFRRAHFRRFAHKNMVVKAKHYKEDEREGVEQAAPPQQPRSNTFKRLSVKRTFSTDLSKAEHCSDTFRRMQSEGEAHHRAQCDEACCSQPSTGASPNSHKPTGAAAALQETSCMMDSQKAWEHGPGVLKLPALGTKPSTPSALSVSLVATAAAHV